MTEMFLVQSLSMSYVLNSNMLVACVCHAEAFVCVLLYSHQENDNHRGAAYFQYGILDINGGQVSVGSVHDSSSQTCVSLSPFLRFFYSK